jgi:hypothetical protein
MNKKEFDFEIAKKEALKICEGCRYLQKLSDNYFCGRKYLVIADVVYYSTGDDPAPPICKKLMSKIDKSMLYH